jgi:ubiquinone/menaquinone biosynthesis C-methylase UbiE
MSATAKQLIEANIAAHDAVADAYEEIHGEIFNDVEQARLRDALTSALSSARSVRGEPTALDVGCGSGNLTQRLLELGCRVTSADVAPRFLELCERRFGDSGRVQTHRLDGVALGSLPSDTFDIAATYSVLHHVPDYLGLIADMVRVVRPGGVIFLDHEASERVYADDPTYREFTERTGMARPLVKRVLTQTRGRRWVIQRVRRDLQPSFRDEGDIHVWPDDHIEFARVLATLRNAGCEIVTDAEYLLYRRGMPRDVYDAYASRCADTRLVVARKAAA